jgi:hypothetical protein
MLALARRPKVEMFAERTNNPQYPYLKSQHIDSRLGTKGKFAIP